MVQESGDAHMTDGAPKRIWAWITGIQPLQGNAGLWRSDEWTITDDEYILAAEHARIVAKKDAEIERLRETAMPTDVLDEVEAFRALVDLAILRAFKAMQRYPQPNYVISKIAEEAGEVVKAAIHCAEGRESADNLTDEMVDTMAMLFRLWIEGDQVHGLASVARLRAAREGK